MEPISNKTFYLITGIISLVVVVGFCINIFINYRKHKELEDNTIFPPWPSKCPDYWASGGDNICRNSHKLGLCKSGDDNDMEFGDQLFKGSKGQFYKCNWAKQCQIPWEGIDNLC